MRERPIGEAVEDDEREKVIAYHRGDAHAAIDTLLEDIPSPSSAVGIDRRRHEPRHGPRLATELPSRLICPR